MYQANPTKRAPARPVAASNDRQRDGVEYCLDVWADWMRRDDRDLGIKGPRGESDGDPAEARHFNDIAEATDAMMQSLVPRHQWAIKKKFGLARVWHFPNADFPTSFAEAVAALEPLLRKNLATRMQFG
ncbi:hypothetical protein Herbaro_09350 [Herbaspirillum sp. WKF16]|uniref:hypothetical protein n=1 Tax=Herbaspirillum sp. WKF16 TaxID=3028312 RepID=UPI0023A9A386|nr:hypothetical protein [Herbaspirillum sp. WKF16]WDZ97966.1 hypothetical protein Herbaro_09350 [Herbaspirillum sp. WKF16]